MTEKNSDNSPPFFKTWPQVYTFVLACLGLYIVFLFWFSTWYQ